MTTLIKNLLSKLAALAVLFTAILTFATAVAAPLYERWLDVGERIAQNRMLLGRYLSTSTSGPSSADAAASPDEYLQGETDALRLANFQARLSALAKEDHIRLASTRAAELPDRAGLRLLGLHAQLSTELDQLQSLLYSLEAKEKGLFIEMLHILRGARAEGMTLPSLDVSIVVAGAVPGKEE